MEFHFTSGDIFETLNKMEKGFSGDRLHLLVSIKRHPAVQNIKHG